MVFFGQRMIVHLNGVLRRALEYVELLNIGGNSLNHLNSRCSHPNNTDALTAKINAFLGPPRGVQYCAGEGVLIGEQRRVRRRQHTHAADQITSVPRLTALAGYKPNTLLLLPHCAGNPSVKRYVGPKLKLVCHVFEITFDFRLRCESL